MDRPTGSSHDVQPHVAAGINNLGRGCSSTSERPALWTGAGFSRPRPEYLRVLARTGSVAAYLNGRVHAFPRRSALVLPGGRLELEARSHAKDARAAHWNKPRANSTRESARIGSTLTLVAIRRTRCFSARRVIQGRTSPARTRRSFHSLESRVSRTCTRSFWYGDPQVLFHRQSGYRLSSIGPIAVGADAGFEPSERPTGTHHPAQTPRIRLLLRAGRRAPTGARPPDKTADGTGYNVNNLEAGR